MVATSEKRNVRVVALALLLASGLVYLAYASAGPRQAGLAAVGLLLGLALYHASFGFTAAWRNWIEAKKTAGLRAQLLMLALASALFLPVLGWGEIFGSSVGGAFAPLGLSVAVGAFIFGIGMQLAGGCASGTLFAAGGGSRHMVVVLGAFIAGSLIATHHVDWWWALPELPPISLAGEFGVLGGLAFSLALLAAFYLIARRQEMSRYGSLDPVWSKIEPRALLRGPWPLLLGAGALALLNFATLSLAGRPWGITSAFALWGAKGAGVVGLDVFDWPYWQGSEAYVSASVFADINSVMNFGIILGAAVAAGLAGKFHRARPITLAGLTRGIIGGLMLGYGARLAYGCNIGAYFSGVASGSLHGWLWLAAAIPGNMFGARLRSGFFGGG